MWPGTERDPLEPSHEVLTRFAEHGLALNKTLTAMLDEHHTHRTERRGCGFTQATRHLAEHVNYPHRELEYEDSRLFADRSPGGLPRLRAIAEEMAIPFTWRNLDRTPPDPRLLADPEFASLAQIEIARQQTIRALPDTLEREESRVLARILRDIVLPVDAAARGLPALPLWPDRLEIGTCPLAEKYFLELADRFVRRRGRLNIIVDDADRPLLIEKLGLGDDHSCISVTPLVLNAVTLPAASLFGVYYDDLEGTPENLELPGHVIPLARCRGFRFLRLTTLSVSPENRARAFSTHFQAQVEGGLFGPGIVEIATLEAVARAQLPGAPR